MSSKSGGNGRTTQHSVWSIWAASACLASLFVLYGDLRSSAAQEVPQAVLDAERARIDAVAKASRSAVAVFEQSGQGGGSGVVVTPDGYALTNYHVTQPCGEFMKCSMNDGRLYDAVLCGFDPVGDVALIKLLGREDFPAAELADSDTVRVGDWCFAVGNPLLLATDFQPTISFGIVSGVHRYQYPAGTLLEYADCIQTDAAINPGNSGGPLFNALGQVIGINGRGSFEKRGRVNVGVGYAISINQIKHFMGHLRGGRIVDHATLGATVGTDDAGKVLVTNILESSDAFRRGLQYGDEIVSFGGRAIGSTNAFKNVLGIFPKGWRVPLVYRRQGETKQIVVRLAGVHSDEELLQLVSRRPEAKPGSKPRPGGQPNEKPSDKPAEKPGEKPSEKPRPTPSAKPDANAPPAIPEAAQKLIKKRTGFANFYFNELNRERVWSAAKRHGDFSSAAGTWKFSGQIEGGGEAQIELGPKTLAATTPAGAFAVDLTKDLDEQPAPPQSGGLLVALHQWKRLATLGPDKFGAVTYLGTLPLPDSSAVCDVLTGVHEVVETRFFYSPTDARLVALECSLEERGDPCEVLFGDFRDVGGRQLPHRMEVRNGAGTYAVFVWKSIELTPTTEAK
ncbi:MAG: trypsin-like peptidase domain-containing protein [Pirellulales bacterium]